MTRSVSAPSTMPSHRARAAADRDAADDRRGDHGELEAVGDAGVDRGVARGPERAAEAGEQARDAEGERARSRRDGMPISAAPSGLEPMREELAAGLGAAEQRSRRRRG